jgi:hypothetical protein
MHGEVSQAKSSRKDAKAQSKKDMSLVALRLGVFA